MGYYTENGATFATNYSEKEKEIIVLTWEKRKEQELPGQMNHVPQ